MKKRYMILALALSASMALTMTACGSTKSSTDTTADTTTETAADTTSNEAISEDNSELSAEAENSAEESTELTPYDELIQNVAEQIKGGWQNKMPEDLGVSAVFQMGSDSFGYCKMDINGDGIDELLLGESPEGGDSVIYDLYTMTSDGQLVQLYNGGERDRLYLVKDHDGLIANEGSSSADDSVLQYFTIENGELKQADAPSETVTYDTINFTLFNDANTYVSNTGSNPEDNWTECSMADLQEKLGSSFIIPVDAEADINCRWYTDLERAEVVFHIGDKDYNLRAEKASEFKEITDLVYSNYDSETDCQVCGKYQGVERRVADGSSYFDSIQWYNSDTGLMYSLTATSSSPLDGFDIQAIAEQISQ